MSKEKQNLPPISLRVYRQKIFDVAADMASDTKDSFEPYIERLITLADWPIKVENKKG